MSYANGEGLTELEAQFKQLCDDHMKEIDEQINIAREAIAKAEKISEKYGIPFGSNITPLSMDYTPASFFGKFDELDSEFICDITGAYCNEYEGWEHSAVC